MLRTQKLVVPCTTTIKDKIRRLSQSVAYAIQATSSTATKNSATDMIFGRDLIIHQWSLVDWNLLRKKKRNQQAKDNMHENNKRIAYEYKVGEKCLIVTKPEKRLGNLIGFHHNGPYVVTKVNSNRTIKIKYRNFEETINICRVNPYHE